MLTKTTAKDFVSRWGQIGDVEDLRLSLQLCVVLTGAEAERISPDAAIRQLSQQAGRWGRLRRHRVSGTFAYLVTRWSELAGLTLRSYETFTFADLCVLVGYWRDILGRRGYPWSELAWEDLAVIASVNVTADRSAATEGLDECRPNALGGILIGSGTAGRDWLGDKRLSALNSLVLAARRYVDCEDEAGCAGARMDGQIVSARAAYGAAATLYSPPVPTGLLRPQDEFEDIDCMTDALCIVERRFLPPGYSLPPGEIGLAAHHVDDPLMTFCSLRYLVQLICDNLRSEEDGCPGDGNRQVLGR